MPTQEEINWKDFKQLAEDCWLFLTNDKLPQKAIIKKEAFLHEVSIMIENAVLFSAERKESAGELFRPEDVGKPVDVVELANSVAELTPEIEESARLYAEGKMYEGWNRNNAIEVGIFYKHYLNYVREHCLSPVPVKPLTDVEINKLVYEKYPTINKPVEYFYSEEYTEDELRREGFKAALQLKGEQK